MEVSDYVYFWKDKLRWLGPAKVVGVEEFGFTIMASKQNIELEQHKENKATNICLG